MIVIISGTEQEAKQFAHQFGVPDGQWLRVVDPVHLQGNFRGKWETPGLVYVGTWRSLLKADGLEAVRDSYYMGSE